MRVDGRWCFGQVAARRASESAAAAAHESGVAVATVLHVHHVGRLGEYVEVVAAAGCIGLAFCNGGPPGGRVVPHGGRRAALATNPLAYRGPGRLTAADRGRLLDLGGGGGSRAAGATERARGARRMARRRGGAPHP